MQLVGTFLHSVTALQNRNGWLRGEGAGEAKSLLLSAQTPAQIYWDYQAGASHIGSTVHLRHPFITVRLPHTSAAIPFLPTSPVEAACPEKSACVRQTLLLLSKTTGALPKGNASIFLGTLGCSVPLICLLILNSYILTPSRRILLHFSKRHRHLAISSGQILFPSLPSDPPGSSIYSPWISTFLSPFP